jgi:hypothetical protein
MEYTEHQESPKAFHEWTAMSVISATLGRHVWIDRGYYTIYPNLFVILVAGSAKCRKSVSTAIGMNLLKSLKDAPMIFSQKITNEALIHALTECRKDNASAGLIYASELSVFMGADAHKSGLIPTLTDLYDSPADWSYRTRGRGVEQLQNVTIAFLGASTKEWLKSSIPADAVGGGFTSRIVFVYQEQPHKPVLFPELARDSGEQKKELIEDLNTIREIRGPMVFEEEARIFAEDWYKKELYKNRDPKLEGYFGRKHDTMFKVASVLSLSESNNRIIKRSHIRRALRMLEENEQHLYSVVDSVMATQAGTNIEKVLQFIRSNGKRIKHSDVLRKCWRMGAADEINTYIRTLLESREITEEVDKHDKCRYYIAN